MISSGGVKLAKAADSRETADTLSDRRVRELIDRGERRNETEETERRKRDDGRSRQAAIASNRCHHSNSVTPMALPNALTRAIGMLHPGNIRHCLTCPRSPTRHCCRSPSVQHLRCARRLPCRHVRPLLRSSEHGTYRKLLFSITGLTLQIGEGGGYPLSRSVASTCHPVRRSDKASGA
jgi:hypothetical protein